MASDPFLGEVERVYREQGDRLWRSIFLLSGNEELASDAVAEAFAQALRRGPGIRSLERWIWRTAFRIGLGALTKERTEIHLRSEGEVTYEPEISLDIMSALGQLSRAQRGAIILFYYADRPVRDVARILGSTPPAVGVHLHRARANLRSLLEADDD